MTINERIKEVRKSEEVNMTMEEFGKRLGVKDATISRLESGARNVTDQMFKSICREFGVNPTWLRTGEGTMWTADTTTDGMKELSKKFMSNVPEPIRNRLVSALAQLSDKQWKSLSEILDVLIKEEKGEEKGEDPRPASSVEDDEEAYRKSLGIAQNTDTTASSTTEDIGRREA